MKPFSTLIPYIVSNYDICDYFVITMYSNYAPKTGDEYEHQGREYVVESVTDVTTDEESEEGLSFSEVRIERKE